ncbi:MAG: universal stress protein [Thermodesulfobacteriota bacterium]
MTGKQLRKILAGLDGSDRAISVVKYLGNTASLKTCDVTLLSIHDEISQAYRELGRQKQYHAKVSGVVTWELEQKRKLEKHLNAAKQILTDNGYPEKSVKVKLKKREHGIARDIMSEAGHGYDAVAVGRKGVSQLREMVLGSVSMRLMEKLHSMPLMLIGKDAEPGKVLIGFDGSENAMRAVHFVGQALKGSDHPVSLLHVVRSDEDELAQNVKTDMAQPFDRAREALAGYHVPSDRITTQILYGEESRAGTIVREARSGNYGAIALGRRGLSRIEEFFMGRVTSKVAHMAKGLALWVVN